MRVLELVFMNDGESPRVAGVIRAVIAIIEIIIDHDTRIVIPTEGTPAAVIVAPIPIDPARSPNSRGNPIPTHAQPPAPTAIVISTPAPGLRGNPGPPADRIPEPAAVVIRPPVGMVNMGNPDIAIRPFIGPVSVLGQLVFIRIKLRGQILLGSILNIDGIPVVVPIVKIIPAISQT
jgi:hypothetical protein